MPYDAARHRRRSIRLRGYDYTQTGVYFVTICVQGRACLLGEIVDARMVCNAAGRMIETTWRELSEHYAGVGIDAFVVMPNHIHGVLTLTPTQDTAPTLSLGDIVHRFKTLTTKRYTDGVKQEAWRPYAGRLWQRNYYEHIVRHEKALYAIREYIENNPAHWHKDRNHPDAAADAPDPWHIG